MAEAAQTFGGAVRHLRRAAGLSQEALAERAGISARAVGSIERGSVARPHPASVHLLITALAADDAAAAELRRLAFGGVGEGGPAPAMLPAAHAGFVGRTREQTTLVATLRSASTDRPRPVVVLVHGPPGVGKTALALRVGHGIAAHFPDGTLFASLRGASPSPTPTHPLLLGLCQTLGASTAAVPADPDQRAAFFRSLLGGRRILIVCDDARDAAQVAPLLPGTGGCAVLVTSRWALSDPAIDLYLPLDTLDEATAGDLLRAALGDRLDESPTAVRTIADACGGLPLALRITAARLTMHPAWTLTAYADMLNRSPDRLSQLQVGDTAVRAAIEESYRVVGELPDGPGLRWAFDCLSMHHGPFVTTAAFAAMAGIDEREADRRLDILAQAHLVSSPTPGVFAMHDLIRECGAAHTAAGDPGRRQAVGRLVAHLTAQAGTPFARGWFNHERANVVAAAAAGADVEPPLAAELATLLAATAELFEYAEDEQGWRAVAEATRRSAQAVADPAAEAAAHDELSVVARLGMCLDDAERHALAALRGYRSLPSTPDTDRAVARAHSRLGTIYTLMARHGDAEACYQASMRTRRADGDSLGVAAVLNNIGVNRLSAGDPADAETSFDEARALYRKLDDALGEGLVLGNLGEAYTRQRRYHDAVAAYRAAIRLAASGGTRSSLHYAMCGLADTLREVGHPAWAGELYRRCLTDMKGSENRHLLETVEDGLAQLTGEPHAGPRG
jgi:tetratricopeptide (TPR) repeat protein/DNA-binding XRE family transcriptional regulator